MFDGKFRKRLQERPLLSNRKKVFGQGQRVKQAQERANTMTSRFKDRKPNILPQVKETLGQAKIGSRVSEIIPDFTSKKTPESDSKTSMQPRKRREAKKKTEQKDFKGDISIST